LHFSVFYKGKEVSGSIERGDVHYSLHGKVDQIFFRSSPLLRFRWF
jgi:hypothetical protein